MSSKNLLRKIVLPILLLVSQLTFAQDKTITGKVVDSKDNSPVSKASVRVKGSGAGTSTADDGIFRITVAQSVSALIISSVGFENQEIDISGKTDVTVNLVASTTGLSEVVVIGYGTARKKDLTGAVASIQSKDFNKGTFTSPDQLIQGKAAGVLMMNNTGQPGGSSTVRIRGSSSIRSGNQPLFVVDGVPLSGGSARPGGGGSGGEFGNDGGNPLNYINPNDISNIEILKDASATAIYGSRGANGVVIITTKKGKAGAPTIDVGATTGFSKVMKKLEVLDAGEFRKALSDYNLTSGDYGGNADAFDAITQTGLLQNYNVAIGGGTENGRYRLSVGYLDQKGAIKTSEFKKLMANLTTNFKFLESKKLGLDINIMTSQTEERIAPISAFVGFTGNLISQALQWNPTHPLIKPGTDSAWIDPLVSSTTINPLAQLNYYEDRAKVTTILASISPSYKITKDLEYRFLYSVNRQVGNRKGQINRLLNFEPTVGRGAAFINNSEQTNSQLTHTLNYNKQINKDFNVNAVVGYEWLIFDSKNYNESALNFANNGLKYYDMLSTAPQANVNINSFASPTTELQSYFGRAMVNYKDKYLITGTFRADGSTKFGKNNKYGYFPSIALAWNASKESFLSGVTFIQNLKVRAGWGRTGNQEFPSGASLDRFQLGQGGATTRINFANPDLKWETSSTYNAGIDFSILNNKLSGSIDYFSKKTTDILFESTLADPGPPSGKIWKNLDGEVENSGVEISLLGTILNREDLSWTLGGNVTFLKNNVTGLAGYYETGALRGQGFSGVFGQRMINDQPLNVWYLRRFEGLDKAGGTSIYTDGGNTKYYVGSPNPKTLLGISTEVNYKKLYAVVNMNGTFGHYIFNNTAASVLGIPNLNASRNIAKQFVGGDVQESIANAPQASTRYLEKGNYLKLANATLGYRIGNIGKAVKNLNITVTGQNLFVITKYTGFDPEVNTDAGNGGIPSFGVEYIPYPSARTVQLGINFSL